jgi:hypothetical protein
MDVVNEILELVKILVRRDSPENDVCSPPKRRKLKAPKKSKTIPIHSHDVSSIDPHCALCVSHGNCMDSSVCSVGYTMEERLK